MIVRLRRQGYENDVARQVEFVPDPVAWTEVPESLRVLGRQRDRWHRGLSDTLWRHREVMLRPRYGALGMVLFPVFVTIEWFAPVVEAIGLLMLIAGLLVGAVDMQFAVLFFTVAYGLGFLLSIIAILLEEMSFRRYGESSDRAWLLLWAVVENLGLPPAHRGVAAPRHLRLPAWGLDVGGNGTSRLRRRGVVPARTDRRA